MSHNSLVIACTLILPVFLLTLTLQQNENKDEGENLTKEEEEEVENDDVKTPTSPMLKETENATGDFEFHRA